MRVLDADEAVQAIPDGATVTVSGNGSLLLPERLLEALERSFLARGRPRDLTLFYPVVVGTGPGTGVDHLAHPGLVRAVVASCFDIWGIDRLARRIRAEEVEAHCLPMGVMFQLLQAAAAGQPGILTRVGLDTFVDPLVRGTAQNRRTQGSLAERWDVDGVPHLFYRAPRIGAALLRATVADEDGSLALTREPIEQALLAMALAARAGGGPVLAEVRAVVRRRSLPAREVRVPGCLVDAVVVAPEAAGPDDPRLTGEWAVRPEAPPLPLTPDKVMARRALWELRPGMLVNLGFGLATLVAQVAAEEGVAERVTFSVEHGPLGGLPAGTRTFGASAGPQAILRAPDVFALYHAGLLDLAVLSAAEVDREGNANVSRFGDAMPGPGGYVDITGCTRSLVLLVALTAGGTRLEVADGGLRVAAEGRIPRFVPEVRERTFSGPAALARGARVRYVTDRCTFELRPEGLTLTEVAPGIDVRRDVLDRMGFAPRVAPVLRRWPAALFAEGPMGLQDRWG